MPYTDNDHVLSDEQAVTATAVSTNVVDLGADGNSDGRQMRLIVDCTEAATAAGAATVTFSFETDDNTAFSSATTLASTAAIGKAALTAASRVWELTLPKTVERYVRVNYTVATGPLTAGKFKAYLAREA
tara:strand:+ start:4794 stop:5183 length:390 start_codon:yes stop_codon:yes gene_type:complete